MSPKYNDKINLIHLFAGDFISIKYKDTATETDKNVKLQINAINPENKEISGDNIGEELGNNQIPDITITKISKKSKNPIIQSINEKIIFTEFNYENYISKI